MASVNICDLCGNMTKQKFSHRIILRDLKSKSDSDKTGEICTKCFNGLVARLESEGRPNPPRATINDTPSRQQGASLDAIGIVVDNNLSVGKTAAIREDLSKDELDVIKKYFLKTGENLNNILSEEDIKNMGTINKQTGQRSTKQLVEGELRIVKSKFTEEKKRQVLKELSKKCSHPKGFSMSDDGMGIKCKTCNEKARF